MEKPASGLWVRAVLPAEDGTHALRIAQRLQAGGDTLAVEISDKRGQIIFNDRQIRSLDVQPT